LANDHDVDRRLGVPLERFEQRHVRERLLGGAA
jgi:hypothetical protein